MDSKQSFLSEVRMVIRANYTSHFKLYQAIFVSVFIYMYRGPQSDAQNISLGDAIGPSSLHHIVFR